SAAPLRHRGRDRAPAPAGADDAAAPQRVAGAAGRCRVTRQCADRAGRDGLARRAGQRAHASGHGAATARVGDLCACRRIRAAYASAVANTAAAEANLRRLVETRGFTRIAAPFTGVITARNVDMGSLISAAGATSAPVGGSAGTVSSGSLFRIAQTDTVRTY